MEGAFQVAMGKKCQKNDGNPGPEEMESQYEDASATESVMSKNMKSNAGHDKPLNEETVF